MIELLIFDLDGTLIDSRLDIATGINHALAEISGVTVAPERIFPYIGSSLRNTFVNLAEDVSESVIDRMIETYKAYYYEHCAVYTKVYPGVFNTLEILSGFSRAIATAKRGFMAEHVAEVLNLTPHFDLIRGTDEGTPLKPAPDLFLEVMAYFKVKPENAICIGDTDHDILAGRAAGCKTVAVTYGIRSREELVRTNPDFLIDSITELIGIVKSPNEANPESTLS